MEVINVIIPVYQVDDPFSFYQLSVLNNTLNGRERENYEQIHFKYQRCFQLIKAHEKEAAAQQLQEGDLILAEAGEKVKFMVAAFCMPFTSYYYYKTGDFKRAITRTEFIIDQVSELEKGGDEYLFFSRMQQNQNIGRILWADHEAEQAINIYAQCVLDIYFKSSDWKTTQVIDGIPVTMIAKDTQYQFIIQVFTEALNCVLKKFKGEKTMAVLYIDQFIGPLVLLDFKNLNSDDFRYQSFDDFIKIFQHFIVGSDHDFLSECVLFFNNGSFDEEMRKTIGRYLYYFGYI